jgi:hypothetical protein
VIVKDVNKEGPYTSKYGHFVEAIKIELRA